MTNISQVAKETQMRHMEEAHHPKMQYDTNAIQVDMYIKRNMIYDKMRDTNVKPTKVYTS
jgi:hypothetical protein